MSYAISGSRNTLGAFSINHSTANALPAISANSRLGSLDRISVAMFQKEATVKHEICICMFWCLEENLRPNTTPKFLAFIKFSSECFWMLANDCQFDLPSYHLKKKEKIPV